MMILTRSYSTTRRVVYCTGMLLLSTGLPGATAEDTCSELTVSGLLESDGFPSEDTIYTNTVEDEDIKGIYLSEEGNHSIWYSPSGLNTESSDFQDATENNCVGKWVISSYPFGEEVTEEVWYQANVGPQCQINPSEVDSSYWERVERVSTVTDSESIVVSVACVEEGDGGGLSNRDVILILIAVGVGFMVCLCCGALICCIRGKNSNEEAVMPPGELTEGSVIGMKAEELKPGLHAHPEVRGKQHPRPEDWAPSHASSGSIPLGSRSGPSVRSIGYT